MCRQYCSNIYAFVNFQLFQGCNVFRRDFEPVAWMEARPRWPGWVLVTCRCITRRLKAEATQGLDNQHYHSASGYLPLELVTIRLQRNQEFSILGFSGWDFAKSRDPGIFRDGTSLKFYPGILPAKYGIFLDFTLSA